MKNIVTKIKKTAQGKNNVYVAFGSNFNIKKLGSKRFDVVVADSVHKNDIENLGCTFVDIGTLIGPGSIEEANIFLVKLSSATFPNGELISKSFLYERYELWWVHYNNFFHYFCMPFTQYKKLLEYLRNFENVSFYNPPFKNLFLYYLSAYECPVSIFGESWLKKKSVIPLGVLVQIIITFFSILILAIKRPQILVFTGDSLEPSSDYDFRMKFIYEELRNKNLSFVEFIRSLESWKTVIKHAIIRRRPVVYSEAVAFVGKLISLATIERYDISQKINIKNSTVSMSPDDRFIYTVATHYLIGAYDDIWAIRIMRLIERIIGVMAAFIPAVNERNFSTFLGCKMNNISTVGILHGIASRFTNPYDFMKGYSGKKMLSVDVYGVWSVWWKEYYVKYSQTYKPEQLVVSGPMRPLDDVVVQPNKISTQTHTKVLFVSEQVAAPNEALPYLEELVGSEDIELSIKFRPSRDGFEEWLTKNEPQILKNPKLRIIRGGMQDAIQNADVVVGSYSTGVLEALLQLRVPILFNTQKYGDIYGMSETNTTRCLFAQNPKELIEKIMDTHALSVELLVELREQYFGDSQKNGSKWVVNTLKQLL